MGILRGRKPKHVETEGDAVDTSPPLALAREDSAHDTTTPSSGNADSSVADARHEGDLEAGADASWVRLGADALWAGVLPDHALGTLPGAEEDSEPQAGASEQVSSEIPVDAVQVGEQARESGADALDIASSRAQEPGTPEFRILCGATTPSDIRRRFGWKTDKELAEAYEIATQERARAEETGEQQELAYWDALVEASVKEAVDRPAFGEVDEWDEEHGRREKRQTAKRLQALADAREAMRRANEST